MLIFTIIVTVNAIIYWPIITGNGMVIPRDPAMVPTTSASLALMFPQWSWQGQYSLVSGQSGMIASILYFPLLLWHLVGWDVGSFSRWMPFFLSVLGCLGMDRFLRAHFPFINISSRLIGILVFATSPWLVDRFGYWFMWIGYMILPWSFALIEESLMMRSKARIFWAGVILGFAGNVITVFVGVITATILFIHEYQLLSMKKGKTLILYILIGSSGLVLASLYWALPLITSMVIDSQYVIGAVTIATTGALFGNYQWVNYVIGASPWWPHLISNGYGAMHYLWPIAITIFLILIIAHFLLGSWGNRSNAGFWMLVIGWFIATWPLGPLKGVYNFIVYSDKIPMHQLVHSLFRSPDKINGSLVFGFSVMAVSLWEGWIREDTLKNRLRPGLTIIRLILIIVWALISIPSIATGYWGIYRPIAISSDVQAMYMEGKMLPDINKVNTLFVTTPGDKQAYDSRYGYTQFKWGSGIAYTISFESSGWPGVVLNAQSTEGNVLVIRMTQAVADGNWVLAKQIAKQYGIGYIVVHDDVITDRPVVWGEGNNGITRIWRKGDISIYHVQGVNSLASPFQFTPNWYGYELTGKPGTARIGIPNVGGWYAVHGVLSSQGGWTLLSKMNSGTLTVLYVPTIVEVGTIGLYLFILILYGLFAWRRHIRNLKEQRIHNPEWLFRHIQDLLE